MDNPETNNDVINISDEAFLIAHSTIEGESNKQEFLKSYEAIKDAEWDEVYTQGIFDIKDESFVGKPVKILAMISTLSDPKPLQLSDGTRKTILSMSLEDQFGENIECLIVPSDKFGRKIFQSQRHQSYLIFLGTAVSIIHDSFTGYKFYIHDIVDQISADDRIHIQAGDFTLRDEFIEARNKDFGVFHLIKSRLVDNLGIKGLDEAKELNQCIDFMIIQSFSDGKKGSNSMKLHSLVVGAPGVGKKLLTIIAKILNPVSEEVSDSKISIAGLIGNVTRKNNRYSSSPGYLPLCTSGIVCIQDFHEVKQDRDKIMGTFSKMMEDGEVIDSTSARQTHVANTSIHLDTNRLSEVRLTDSNKYSEYEDINIPTNIISRFDFIKEIPRDAERQSKVAYEIMKGEKILSTYGSPKEEEKWQRELKRIVAYLRTNFVHCIISDDLAEYRSNKVKVLVETTKNPDSFADMITRLANSVDKYVKAITCMNSRVDATKNDIDLAFSFIEGKIQFMERYFGSLNENMNGEIYVIPVEGRKDFIIEHLGGQKVTFEDVKKLIAEKGIPCSDSTLRRDLRDISTKAGHGYYQVNEKTE